MVRRSGQLILLMVFVGTTLGRAPAAAAVGDATFKVTVKSAFLRSEPSLSATRVFSVFRGQVYTISGRNGDNTWLLLSVAGLSGGAWILKSLGEVSGDLGAIPVAWAGAQPGPAVSTPAAATGTSTGPAANSSTASLRFTITANSAFARNAPAFGAARIRSVFKGEVYTAVGRNGSSQWIQIRIDSTLGWVPANIGQLKGDITRLPVTDNVEPGQSNAAWDSANPGGSGQPPWIPVITPYMRLAYERSQEFGHSLSMFAAIGDCNSESPVYLRRVAEGRFSLRGYEHLQATLDYFAESFRRDSLAVYGGFNTGSIIDPTWGHPTYCHRPEENAFACELRLSQASIAFIQLGTGDQYIWRSSEANYRAMIEYALQNGVLPVLVTKADAIESLAGDAEPDYLNSVQRRLAQEYQIPLVDFWLATRSLPNYGLQADGFHLNEEGINLHILVTLQTLQAIWRR